MNRTLADPPLAAPEVIAVASQKGGVGKSTTAMNLAIALVAAGRTVLLMDLDPQGQVGLTLMSGVQVGGTERMLREAALTREMMTATEIPELFLVPAGPGLNGIESELALLGDSRTRLHQALATLPALPFQFDYIVLDCPPSVGLLTLNALAAAHQILLPVPCESVVLEGLPHLLKTIGRLRAGLRQPLLGVHLLLVRRTSSASAQALVRTLRQDYGHLMLLTEIPLDDAVRDAAERGLPLLAHCPQCDVSQAYLELAAEWLMGHDEREQPKTGWSFRTRQERMASERDRMCARIQAWLTDPSSLLYDETWETRRQQDAVVFDELFRPLPPQRRTRTRLFLLALLAMSVALLSYMRWLNIPGQDVSTALAPHPEPRLPDTALSDATILPPSANTDPVKDGFAPSAPLPDASGPESGKLAARRLDEPDRQQPQDAPATPTPANLPSDPAFAEASVAPEPPNADSAERAYRPGAWEALFRAEDTADLAPMRLVDALAPGMPQPKTSVEIPILPPPNYRWSVQVLAGRSLERVQEDSQVFMQKYADMLDNRKLAISQSRFGDARDEFYRLRVIGWDSQSAAGDWCKRLRSNGQKCLVIRTDPDED